MTPASELFDTASLDVRPAAGALGAEVRGVSLRNPLTSEALSVLRALLAEHLVLFFPEQHLDIAQLKAFGQTWGPLRREAASSHVASDEDPDVVQLSAMAGYTADIWHTDLTPLQSPPIGSILSMKILPPAGGDTMWSNQYLAYETLSAPIRDLIDNLTAIHEWPRITDRTEHPVVRTIPETGRRCLFVNEQYAARIPQLSKMESDAVLKVLTTHAVQPHLTVRRRWSEGDVAIWDNRCTQHFVVNDFVGERVIQRVTLAGDPIEKLESRYPHHQATTTTLASQADAVRAVTN